MGPMSGPQGLRRGGLRSREREGRKDWRGEGKGREVREEEEEGREGGNGLIV